MKNLNDMKNESPDFTNRPKKRVIQRMIFSQIRSPVFNGLMGSSFEEYLPTIAQWRFKEIRLFEHNRKIFEEFGPIAHKTSNKISCHYGDITKNIKINEFYDFDFCNTISTLSLKTIKRICQVKQFSMTLSLRGITKEKTIEILCYYLKRKEFINIVYKDGNTPMITIFKF